MRYFRGDSQTSETQSGNTALFYGSQALLAFGIAGFLLLAGSLAWVTKPSANASQSPDSLDKVKVLAELEAEDNETEEKPTKLETEVELVEVSSRAEELVKVNKFLGAFSAALKKAGIPNTAVLANSSIRLGEDVARFPIGAAVLPPRMLTKIDSLGIVLDQALACLAQKPVEKISPNILLEETQAQECQRPSTQVRYFKCQKSFASLALESILLEGHADARAIRPGFNGFKDNLNLSSARGEHVLRRLYTCHPGLGKVGNPAGQALLGSSGQSTQRFATPEDQDNEANRRVELKFVPALSR